MYCKLTMEGAVIDVAVSPLACVRYSPRSGMVLRCGGNEGPNGILSERTGRYYQVEGWPAFPEEAENSAGTVALTEIGETEYLELLAALNDGETPDDSSLYEEQEADPSSQEEQTPKKTTAQILREEIGALREQNDMLMECLLEMSEIVYG